MRFPIADLLGFSVTAIVVATAPPAVAQDAKPERSVTLTESEWQAVIEAEGVKAVANYQIQKAQSAYRKLQSAFGPTTPGSQPDAPLPASQLPKVTK